MGPDPRFLPRLRELGAKDWPDAPEGERNFGFSGATKSKSLEKMQKNARCGIHEDDQTSKVRESGANNRKNEDPAKMTHSIPDFVSRGWPKTQDFFPDLESASPRYKIKT